MVKYIHVGLSNRVILELLEIKGRREIMVFQENLDQEEHQDKLEQQVLLDCLESKDKEDLQ